MTQFIQALIDGTTTGALYALVSLGFVLVFRASGVVNFAHGSIVMFGAYMSYTAIDSWELPYAVGLAIGIASGAALGALLQLGILNRMAEEATFSVVLATLGLSLALRGIIGVVFGVEQQGFSAPFDGETYTPGDFTLWRVAAVLMLVTVAVFALTRALVTKSRIGIAMRAMADDQAVARLMGISVTAVFVAAWLLAGATGAIAGVFVAHTTFLSNNLSAIGFRVLPAVVIGGFDSITGALVGGLILGLSEQLAATYVDGNLAELAGFVVLLIMLLVKPAGLFGTKELKRV